MNAQFTSKDIHCNKCAQRVKNALADRPGVQRVEVDVPAKRVEVEFDQTLTTADALVAAMASAGYNVD